VILAASKRRIILCSMGHAAPHSPGCNMDIAETLQLVHQAVKRGAFDEVIARELRSRATSASNRRVPPARHDDCPHSLVHKLRT
jgi:hypothetical protein